VISNF